MELKVTEISYELDNEDGLSSLFFECEDGYFTIARMDEDENIYLEKDNQSNGQYFNPDCFEYSFVPERISFSINLNNKRILQYLNENNLDAAMYGNIALLFEPVPPQNFKEMGEVLDKIFDEE